MEITSVLSEKTQQIGSDRGIRIWLILRKNEWDALRDYTSEMLEQVVASELLNGISEECENPAGRLFNRASAQSIGLLSEE